MCFRNSARTAFLIGSALALSGCAFRLPAVVPPSQEMIRISSTAPEQYTVKVNTGTVTDFDVPHDGRLKVGVPPYRARCGVYLFNAIKVGGYGDPLKAWRLSISRNGKTVRNLSLRDMRRLPADEAGYHIVKMAN